MLAPTESWSTQQLVEFVALVSGASSEDDATQRAVERTAEAFEAEVCALIRDGRVTGTIGFPAGATPDAELARVFECGLDRIELRELGELRMASVALEGEAATGLLVGRVGSDEFNQEESDLLRGIARVLALTLRMVRTDQEERELRQRSRQEVRERERVERELAHQALHDTLTGLPNRILLRDRAARALERARGSSRVVGALLVELDHFKLTNESLGHDRADELLVMLTRRLRDVLELGDEDQRGFTLARVGGDEFMVLCDDLSDEREAVAVAERIKDGLSASFALADQRVSLTASIGVAVARDEQASPDALLRDADVAMSSAKAGGRDRYELFDEHMRIRLLDRVQLEADLRAGIERDELRLAYQPVVAVHDGSLVAVEALVRWEHPTRGLLAPAEFIPLAEESDLIVSLGRWVLEEACRQLVRWRDADPAELSVRVSVNVSARQLTPGLVGLVADVLARTGVDPGSIALEITETLLIEQAESSGGTLAALKQLGVGIVLDDFGTGYSSLGYLRSFPLDQLKLDRSFISELARDPRSTKIVSATIEMARALGMTVVAEGVETAEQLGVLRRLGCDYAQGFYFARPQPPDEILARVRQAFEVDRGLIEESAGASRRAVGLQVAAPVEEAEVRRKVALARMAAWLYLIGGLLALPADLVLHSPSPTWTIVLTALGFISAVVVFMVPWAQISARWLHLVALAGIFQVTLSVIAVGNRASVLTSLYLIIATALAYAFRDRRVLAGYVLLMGAAIALPLAYLHHQPQDTAPRTLLTILTLAVTVAVVATLRERMDSSHAELRELASRDPLTGIGNYRQLHERLRYELHRHQRGGHSLAVLLVDLDRFKQVNTRLGHAAGDDVLRRVAGVLSGTVRKQDIVARQGGDEFAVLAPETDRESATLLAVRIRERLGRVQFAGHAIAATVGVAIYPSDGDSAEALLACADAHLLASKSRSRRPAPTSVSRARTGREPTPAVIAALRS